MSGRKHDKIDNKKQIVIITIVLFVLIIINITIISVGCQKSRLDALKSVFTVVLVTTSGKNNLLYTPSVYRWHTVAQ